MKLKSLSNCEVGDEQASPQEPSSCYVSGCPQRHCRGVRAADGDIVGKGNVIGRLSVLSLRTLLIGLLIAKLEGKHPQVGCAHDVLTALTFAV